MFIKIRSSDGLNLYRFIVVSTPPSPSRPPLQSHLLGKRIEVELGDEADAKVVPGTVLRADVEGVHLALLDDGVLLGWDNDGAWGVRKTKASTNDYVDPNWSFPFTPGSAIPNSSVVPAFPSTPITKPDMSWHLSYVEEDVVVAEARAATEAWLATAPMPLSRTPEKSSGSEGPWLFLPLVGSYEERDGQWLGWIEDETRAWIAFIQRDGVGVVWVRTADRVLGGVVDAKPIVFARDVATYPPILAPRMRGAVKKIRTHRGIEIHIDRPMGTVIEGVDSDGKRYVFEQHCDYGFFPGSLGDDFDEFDVYMGPNPLAKDVYIIEQLRARSGWWDERKAIVGCDSAPEALKLYSSHVHPRMVGRIGKMSHETFEEALRAHTTTIATLKKSSRAPFIPVTEEDATELVEMDALRAELEAEWGAGVGGEERAGEEVTNFPAKGDNKSVSLRNSKFDRFDVDFALDVQKNHPKVWDLGGNIRGNKQFTILSRVQKQGGSPHTAAEEAAIRLREPWAARHFEDFRPPGVVAQIKWIVTGKLGEQKMKTLLNKEKERRTDKSADATEDRAPLSYPPPSDDFNPPSAPPSSMPPVSAPPPSSGAPMATNAQPSTVDPLMVLPPMPPAKNADVADEETKDLDPGPLSLRTPPSLTPQPNQNIMANENQHSLIRRIIVGTLALAAAGAVDIPADERAAFREYLGGSAAPGVPQRKEAAAPGVPGWTSQDPNGLRRRETEIDAQSKIANLDIENREITFIASTPSVDSHGEVVLQDWIFDRFKKNPVILWAHNQREPPIGRAVKWWVEGGETLYIRVRFSQVNPFAQLIFDMIVEGMVRACSVGFIPHEISRKEVEGQLRTALGKNELCELSVCPVPSNADSVVPKEIEQALTARYERCAIEVERRLASIEENRQKGDNNNSPTPANGNRVGSVPNRQQAPAQPATPSAAKSGGFQGTTKVIMDQQYATTQVRKDGVITHRCGGCGADAQIPLNGLRERIIELEGQRDSFEQKHVLGLSREKALEEAKRLVERERDEVKIKLTEIELAPIIGVDAWQISPVAGRQLAELRIRSGEEAYRDQLQSHREKCNQIKSLADELAKAKNAPPIVPAPVPGQAPATVMSGFPAPGQAPAATDATAQKAADPMVNFINS